MISTSALFKDLSLLGSAFIVIVKTLLAKILVFSCSNWKIKRPKRKLNKKISRMGLYFSTTSFPYNIPNTMRRPSIYIFCRYFLPVFLFVVILLSVTTTPSDLKNGDTKCPIASSVSTEWFPVDPSLEQDDPQLLRYIAKYHLEPPSPHPYTPGIIGLKDPSPLGPVIQAIFKGQRFGVFMEAGAFNGVQESNTLVLERDFGWSGILVEGNSFSLTELRLAFRNSWIADVCLALAPYAQKLKFMHHPGETSSAMIQYSEVGPNPSSETMKNFNEARKNKFISAGYVECFPAYSILSALNITTVDYLSLDVEGAELKVLQNIPFDRINIKVISAEHWIVNGGIPALDNFFKSKNYVRIGAKGNDVFYTQAELLSKYEVSPEILDVWPLFTS